VKGASYERLVAKKMQRIYPKASRGIGQARSGGEIPDVKGTPFWIECKHCGRGNLSITAAYQQAVEAIARFKEVSDFPLRYRFPVVISRLDDDRALPGTPATDLVTLRLEDFQTLCEEADDFRPNPPVSD
jgi:hypothetical protein